MDERPVTGSCERCGRDYHLLIPDPGSGDLQVHAVGSAFAACVSCGRLVGRACCWIGGAGLCIDCAATTVGHPEREAAIAGSAVAMVASASASLAATESELSSLAVAEPEAARGAWEDAWLEVGTQVARADSARQAGAPRLPRVARGSNGDPELLRRMAKAMSIHLERRRAAIGRLATVGRAIARRPKPTPVRPSPASPASPSAVARSPVITGAAADRHALAVPPPTRETASVEPRSAPAAAAPDAARQGAAIAAPRTVRRRHAVPIALVTVLSLTGVAVVAGTVASWRDDGEAVLSSSPRAVSSSGPTAVGSVTMSPGATLPPSFAAPVGFDLDRIGRLTTDGGSVTRVLGSPEVDAFPSPFDRSLRLGAAGSGACLEAPDDGGATAVELDLHIEQGSQLGSLLVAAASEASAWQVEVDLAATPELAPGTWYRMQVRWHGGSGSLRIADRATGANVREASLSPSMAATASAGELCLQVPQGSNGTAVHLDNVRVGS